MTVVTKKVTIVYVKAVEEYGNGEEVTSTVENVVCRTR